jgi:uncharacterized membrane protein YbhN (UPF0104 family)
LKRNHIAGKSTNVGFASIAILVVNYVAFSLISLAASYRFVNGQVLFDAMVEFLIVVIVVVFYSWRAGYSTVFEKGRTRPNRTWRILRFVFQGAISVLVIIFFVVIASGMKNVFVLGSLGVAEFLLVGVWMEISFIMRIIELRNPSDGRRA